MQAISVLGCGYLGVTHAACMAELGHQVVGVDIDPAKVAQLSAGRVPFYEPGLDSLVKRHRGTGRLRFTTSYAEAAAHADIHFLCVGTPQKDCSGAADMRPMQSVIDALAPELTAECLVVGKSTVPVGTAGRLTERLRREAPVGSAAALAWNPEFLREGQGIADTLHPSRIVLGVESESAEKLLRDVYAPLSDAGVPVVVTDLATAELAKSAANAFLATKISFINALAEVCEAAEADVTALAGILSYDPRIGGEFLRPGLGFGGGCLPKDMRALYARAQELRVGSALAFLSEVDAVNQRRRRRAVELVRQQCEGSFDGRRVAVLGVSFKPDSDDVRDSPALQVAHEIEQAGAEVSVYDPRAMDNARRVRPRLRYASGPLEACRDADAVALLTEWPEFGLLDPEILGRVVSHKCVVDARHALDAPAWARAGWRYAALGRPIGP